MMLTTIHSIGLIIIFVKLVELSQAELSVYFWRNCLNFKLAELSLAELFVRQLEHVNRSRQ